jgi:hypothetical protein
MRISSRRGVGSKLQPTNPEIREAASKQEGVLGRRLHLSRVIYWHPMAFNYAVTPTSIALLSTRSRGAKIVQKMPNKVMAPAVTINIEYQTASDA